MDSENKYNHLEELGGSDYVIVEGKPNIKGWTVKSTVGQKIGKVDELLFEAQTRKVRYLVVDLAGNELNVSKDKKILVPIGIAGLYDNGSKQADSVGTIGIAGETVLQTDQSGVVFDNTSGSTSIVYNPYDDGKVIIVPVNEGLLTMLPGYMKGNVSPDVEYYVRHVYEGTPTETIIVTDRPYNSNDFYAHEHFNYDRFYNRDRPRT